MGKIGRVLLVWLGLFCFGAGAGHSCTTFRIDHQGAFFFGRNYDWDVEDALLIVNKRGVAKTAYTRKKETGRPAVWTSKYGSVTFNQYGRGFPTGGMNEAGLVVEVMTLRATVYPAADSRPVVGSLQWVQHQLDNHATVDEVIASDARVRILSGSKAPGLHFLVSDKKGKCASIEFLAGKMVVHTGENMPVMVLANTTYTESVKRWKADADARNGGSDSVSRFIRAADMVSAHDAGISRPPVDYAFDILSRVASRTRTQWRIVYEQTNGRIHFTTRTNKKIRRVDLRRFDFSCGAPAGVLDVNEGPAGDVTGKFRDYTRKANRDLIGASFGKTWFLRNIPAESLDIISRYPDGMTCEP